MSDREPDTPVHRVSRVEDRERLLAEAMAHAEALEKQYKVIPADPRPTGRWKAPLAWCILATAGVVALFPPGWLSGPPLPLPTEGDLSRGFRAAVFLQAQQVEAFRVRNGRLPDDLDEVQARLPGMTLVRSNNRVYQIRGVTDDGTILLFDSASPAESFAAAVPVLAPPEVR